MRKEEKSERILLWLDKWVFFVVVVVVPFFAMPCHGVRFNYTCLSHRSSKKKRKLAPSSPGHRARWRWEKVRLCLCVLYNNNNSCVFPLPSSCVYVCVIKLVSFSFATAQLSNSLILEKRVSFLFAAIVFALNRVNHCYNYKKNEKEGEEKNDRYTVYTQKCTMSSISRPTGCVEFSLSLFLTGSNLKKRERKFLSLFFFWFTIGSNLLVDATNTQDTHGTSEKK